MSGWLRVRKVVARSAAPAVKADPRPVKKRERSVEAACREIAKARGCLFVKNNPRLFIGLTDRLVVMPKGKRPRGSVWWVEFKRPGENPTTIQWDRIAKLRAMGFRADAIDDVGMFKAALDAMLEGY